MVVFREGWDYRGVAKVAKVAERRRGEGRCRVIGEQ